MNNVPAHKTSDLARNPLAYLYQIATHVADELLLRQYKGPVTFDSSAAEYWLEHFQNSDQADLGAPGGSSASQDTLAPTGKRPGNPVMTQAVADEIRVAREAADWFVRLDCGEISEADPRYQRWLHASPAHAEAMQFLHRLSDSLHAQWRGGRGPKQPPRRTH